LGELDSAALDACTQRANDLMALSRERIADELLKLLAVSDPSPTVAIMLERNILRPVLPEITAERLPALKALAASERESNISPDPLRRLAALLANDPTVAEDVASRLRLSNKARKRLSCAVETDLSSSPQVLAYRAGCDCAVDRLLLAGKRDEAADISGWKPPRLPIGGGALIARGLQAGPIVARTLKTIETRWVEAGFPGGDEFERIVSDAVDAAR
jgi:poly(A) polymerase